MIILQPRYEAVRDEAGRTLRDSLSFLDWEVKEIRVVLEERADKLVLRELDLPLISLSDGQTGRARIATAAVKARGLLSLDEPLSECSSFLHLFPSSISRNFPNFPTFFCSLLEIAALSLSRMLASRSPLPPFPTSFLP